MRNLNGIICIPGLFSSAVLLILLCGTLAISSQNIQGSKAHAPENIPPIDRYAPDIFKTATFGLG